MCWNIDGVGNKFEFKTFIDYVSTFQIFGLLETWETSFEKYSSVLVDYKCYVKNAFRHGVMG